MEPTEKQLKFISVIYKTLDIDDPNCQTKQEATKWISDHINEFRETMRLIKNADSPWDYETDYYW
jgi:hypothetical protein